MTAQLKTFTASQFAQLKRQTGRSRGDAYKHLAARCFHDKSVAQKLDFGDLKEVPDLAAPLMFGLAETYLNQTFNEYFFSFYINFIITN